jgi:hypothetical protein
MTNIQSLIPAPCSIAAAMAGGAPIELKSVLLSKGAVR